MLAGEGSMGCHSRALRSLGAAGGLWEEGQGVWTRGRGPGVGGALTGFRQQHSLPPPCPSRFPPHLHLPGALVLSWEPRWKGWICPPWSPSSVQENVLFPPAPALGSHPGTRARETSSGRRRQESRTCSSAGPGVMWGARFKSGHFRADAWAPHPL